ncbi:hypothetical protein MKX01_005874 [Papaver californicum]|nr:hypothetical protein MKX01_005874 [Papaver californicum]
MKSYPVLKKMFTGSNMIPKTTVFSSPRCQRSRYSVLACLCMTSFVVSWRFYSRLCFIHVALPSFIKSSNTHHNMSRELQDCPVQGDSILMQRHRASMSDAKRDQKRIHNREHHARQQYTPEQL